MPYAWQMLAQRVLPPWACLTPQQLVGEGVVGAHCHLLLVPQGPWGAQHPPGGCHPASRGLHGIQWRVSRNSHEHIFNQMLELVMHGNRSCRLHRCSPNI